MDDVVDVLSWFDDEQTCPFEHVVRCADERFEAFTMDDTGHVSLGMFETCVQARVALLQHRDQVDQLREFWPPTLDKPN
jgi:hypothetical protein